MGSLKQLYSQYMCVSKEELLCYFGVSTINENFHVKKNSRTDSDSLHFTEKKYYDKHPKSRHEMAQACISI